MNRHFFLAFDLGATSGRTVLGIVNDQRVELRELTRFPNTMLHFGGHCYWDIHALYRYIVEGLKAAAREGIPLRSVGIDTWGVDFAFVGDDGALAGPGRSPTGTGRPTGWPPGFLPKNCPGNGSMN